ncbi:aminotransferase [Salmonella phage 21]|nr:aminotransferase [Salmonella phage 21]
MPHRKGIHCCQPLVEGLFIFASILQFKREDMPSDVLS